MSSELWQRMKAARQQSGLRQQQIADACSVSRVAVGHWESPDPERRTRPAFDNLQTFAKMTGAPMEWLLSDDSDIDLHWPTDLQEKKLEGGIVEVPYVEGDLGALVACMRTDPEKTAKGCCESTDGVGVVSSVYISNYMSAQFGHEHTPRIFMFMVSDNAMKPEIRKGDAVLIDVDWEIEHGDLIACFTPDSASGYGVREARLVEGEDGEIRAVGVPFNLKYLTVSASNPGGVESLDQILKSAESKSGGALVIGRVIQVRRVYF